jgi:hypothetical protein
VEEAGLTGKFSRSWPGEDSADHSHYAHDAIPEATILTSTMPPFLEAGTQDLLWFYKSQRKASARGGGKKSHEEQKNRE